MDNVLEESLSNMNKNELRREEDRLIDKIWENQHLWRKIKSDIEKLKEEKSDLEELHQAQVKALNIIQRAIHRNPAKETKQ